MSMSVTCTHRTGFFQTGQRYSADATDEGGKTVYRVRPPRGNPRGYSEENFKRFFRIDSRSTSRGRPSYGALKFSESDATVSRLIGRTSL